MYIYKISKLLWRETQPSARAGNGPGGGGRGDMSRGQRVWQRQWRLLPPSARSPQTRAQFKASCRRGSSLSSHFGPDPAEHTGMCSEIWAQTFPWCVWGENQQDFFHVLRFLTHPRVPCWITAILQVLQDCSFSVSVCSLFSTHQSDARTSRMPVYHHKTDIT